MAHGNTILRQLLDLVPREQFQGFVDLHQGDRYVKKLTCWQQFLILLYAQASEKISLRDIQTGLATFRDSTWYHLGLQTASRSTLACANRDRPSAIYESTFFTLLGKCRECASGTASDFRFTEPLFALDSTTVDLCLSLFPWATFREEKGAIKLHTLFNVRSQIPECIVLTDAKRADVKELQALDLETMPQGSVLVMDRGYVDYAQLRRLQASGRFFVVRLKDNAQIVALERFPVQETGVLADERIAFVLPEARKDYPEDLRLVTYADPETGKIYRFLTNHVLLSAKTIADIYRARWQIELFFRWIKQHLQIKTFLGTSKNAVLTQIWTAMIYYLLVLWIAFKAKCRSPLELTRVIRETLLHRIPLINIVHLVPKKAGAVLARAGPAQLAFC